MTDPDQTPPISKIECLRTHTQRWYANQMRGGCIVDGCPYEADRTDVVHVVAGLALNGEGAVLMGRRRAHHSRPDMWEMPGGKVEPTDISVLHALVREWQEELGVRISVGQMIAKAMLEVEVNLEISLFGVAILEGTPQPIVHSQLRWVDLSYAIVNMACAPATYLHFAPAMSYVSRRAR